MNSEVATFVVRKTWHLVPHPTDANIVTCKSLDKFIGKEYLLTFMYLYKFILYNT
ncbi:unnamed protein product [Spirodela intermedia]|uniref:Uncharacterized protein n=1 Tax=Spirodela intermedia TaxID=51605 RepID=A0A7I8KIC5_SPIIN|nr:unnamed protein product [Spirodela intermedia]